MINLTLDVPPDVHDMLVWVDRHTLVVDKRAEGIQGKQGKCTILVHIPRAVTYVHWPDQPPALCWTLSQLLAALKPPAPNY